MPSNKTNLPALLDPNRRFVEIRDEVRPADPRRTALEIYLNDLAIARLDAASRTARTIAEFNRNRRSSRADEERSEGRPHFQPQPPNPHD